jgi:hypothetical protein
MARVATEGRDYPVRGFTGVGRCRFLTSPFPVPLRVSLYRTVRARYHSER